MRLRKWKRPGGLFWFELRPLFDDHHGVWLHGPAGARWGAPHDNGVLPYPVLVLLALGRPWITWWAEDPADRRIEIDICLPPERRSDDWEFIDLELDPVRHEDTGVVEVQDHDEFEIACRDCWIRPEGASLALATAQQMEQALIDHVEPWGAIGWDHLREVT